MFYKNTITLNFILTLDSHTTHTIASTYYYQMLSKFVHNKNSIKNNMISLLFKNNINFMINILNIIVIVIVCVVSIFKFKTILMQFMLLKNFSQKHYRRYHHSHRCNWCNHKDCNCYWVLNKANMMNCLAFMPAVNMSGKYLLGIRYLL